MAETSPIHKLFRISSTHFVQYDGSARLPKEVYAYARNHNGEYPAYIPLRAVVTEFDLGGPKAVVWHGHGPLPAEVMQYVCENGTLPKRKAEGVVDTELSF